MTRWSLAVVTLALGGMGGMLLTERVTKGQAPAPMTAPAERTTYRDVVKKVLPAVVSIESRVKQTQTKSRPPQQRRPGNPNIPDEFRRFMDDMDGPSERSEPQLGFGSGVLIDPRGTILTNYHVVEGAGAVEVELRDGRKFTSKTIMGDRKTDLAIVKLDNVTTSLPYLEFGDSDAMEIGDRVLAVGAPFGLTGTVTSGIISAKGRNLRMNMYEDFLQTDAAINPGNSGGPLVNLDGQIIGINSAIKSRTGGFQGVGLAIASNLARNVATQLQKDGIVKRGYLGVQIRELDPNVASRLGMNDANGVLVSSAVASAPAARGGVQSGDVITGVAGKPIKDGRELQRIVANLPLGKPVPVTVVRDGKPKTLSVTVEEQPEDIDQARITIPQNRRRETESLTAGKVGLDLVDLSSENAEQYGFSERTTGALITGVQSGSVAAVGGLRRGMVILKVDKKAVATAAEAREALEKASLDKGILLQVGSPQGGVNYVILRSDKESPQ